MGIRPSSSLVVHLASNQGSKIQNKSIIPIKRKLFTYNAFALEE